MRVVFQNGTERSLSDTLAEKLIAEGKCVKLADDLQMARQEFDEPSIRGANMYFKMLGNQETAARMQAILDAHRENSNFNIRHA